MKMHRFFFIHSLIMDRLFPVIVATSSNGAMKISLYTCVKVSLGYVPGSRITTSWGYVASA